MDMSLSRDRELHDYIVEKWKKSFNEPNGTLKHKFLDPAAAYRGQLWDWDSFFCGFALLDVYEDTFISKEKSGDVSTLFVSIFAIASKAREAGFQIPCQRVFFRGWRQRPFPQTGRQAPRKHKRSCRRQDFR